MLEKAFFELEQEIIQKVIKQILSSFSTEYPFSGRQNLLESGDLFSVCIV